MTDIFPVTYPQCQETQRNAWIQNSRVLQRKEIAVWNSIVILSNLSSFIGDVFDFKNSPYNVRILLPPPKKNRHIAVWKTSWGSSSLGKFTYS